MLPATLRLPHKGEATVQKLGTTFLLCTPRSRDLGEATKVPGEESRARPCRARKTLLTELTRKGKQRSGVLKSMCQGLGRA